MIFEVTRQDQLQSIPHNSTISNNYFELTLNSDKLSFIFDRINKTFAQQKQRISTLENDLQKMSEKFKDNMETQSRKTGLLFNKLDLRIDQKIKVQMFYLDQIESKINAKSQQQTKSIQEVKRQTGRVEDQCKEHCKRQLYLLKSEIIGEEYPQLTQKDEKEGNQREQERQLQTERLKHLDLNSMMKKFEIELAKIKEGCEITFNQLYKKKEIENKDVVKNLQTNWKNVGFGKQNQQTQEQGSTQSKVLYAKKGESGKQIIHCEENQDTRNQQNIAKSPNKPTRHISLSRNSVLGSEGFNQGFVFELSQKIGKIENIIQQNIGNHSNFKNKQIVIEEKVSILQRKIEKIAFQATQLKSSIRKLECLKQDEKVIEELRNFLKWGMKDLEDKLSKTISQEDLTRQKNKLMEKIFILHENLIQKAEKEEIQKAFVFLQGKIKQIILLIASEQTEERNGAIIKIATKCLSCDKEVQRNVESQSKSRRELGSKALPGQYIKSLTNKMRQRFKKQMAKTLGDEHFND